jgi:hypothetical protein
MRIEKPDEEVTAWLADAIYQVALRRGITGSFLDVELELWAATREVVEGGFPAPVPHTPATRAMRRFAAQPRHEEVQPWQA